MKNLLYRIADIKLMSKNILLIIFVEKLKQRSQSADTVLHYGVNVRNQHETSNVETLSQGGDSKRKITHT